MAENTTDKNMKIWNEVCETPPQHTKQVKLGRNITTIDPYYQLMKATELFGPFGSKWGVKNEKFDLIISDTTILYTAILFYPGGEIPLHADHNVCRKDGSSRVQDAFKIVATDALTKGLSKLGFSADVFLGKYDDVKYVQELKRKELEKAEKKDPDKKNALNTTLKFLNDNAQNISESFFEETLKILERSDELTVGQIRTVYKQIKDRIAAEKAGDQMVDEAMNALEGEAS
jgi:hypothetical protein